MNSKSFLLGTLLFSLSFVGCNNVNKLPSVVNTLPDIQISKIDLNKVECEFVDASYLGYLQFINDTLFYIDDKFCTIFSFDNEGRFSGKHLRQGQGPNELATRNIVGFCHLNDDRYFLVGPSNDCYIFNNQFEKESFFLIAPNKKKPKVSYEDPFLYTLCYPKLILRNYKNIVYSNVFCEHPDLHMFTSYQRYKENAHSIVSINIETGERTKVFGDYPETYEEDNTKQFSFVNYDIDKEGNFYVNYEADSLIYVYDNDFNPITAFGYDGKNMNKNYSTLHTIRDFRKESMEQREKYSYFTWLEYIDEQKLLFRSYKKENDLGKDGLQIYKENVLIGDVETPKDFKVIGYYEPYFYASVPIDEENEKIVFYKFKL